MNEENSNYYSKNFNTNNKNSYTNLSSEQIFELELYKRRLLALYLFSISSVLSFKSTFKGIDLIYKNEENSNEELVPTYFGLIAEIISVIAKLILLNNAIIRYKNLYFLHLQGKITYSLQPNLDFIYANITSLVSSLYVLRGILSIINRSIDEPILGV